MLNEKKFLGIIPARSGSKGLPGKNVRVLNGKPLIAWTIEQALNSIFIDDVIVSTDSSEIAQVAEDYGASVPFLRPANLSKDESPTSDAVLHVLEEMEKRGRTYSFVILLEPTSPLRASNDIDNAIKLIAQSNDAVGLVSVGEVHMEHPSIVKEINQAGFVESYVKGIKQIHQRQQADKAYFPYGVAYISKISEYRRTRTFYSSKTIPYFIERWQNYEIDDAIDFMIVEQILKLKKEKQSG